MQLRAGRAGDNLLNLDAPQSHSESLKEDYETELQELRAQLKERDTELESREALPPEDDLGAVGEEVRTIQSKNDTLMATVEALRQENHQLKTQAANAAADGSKLSYLANEPAIEKSPKDVAFILNTRADLAANIAELHSMCCTTRKKLVQVCVDHCRWSVADRRTGGV